MKYLGIFLICFVLTQAVSAQQSAIENKKWVLEKIRDLKSQKIVNPKEYHYLEFKNGTVYFSVDCNNCSSSYEFISREIIHISGDQLCTRKGCLEKDTNQVIYSGDYKIWL